jgi:hypothetical protein
LNISEIMNLKMANTDQHQLTMTIIKNNNEFRNMLSKSISLRNWNVKTTKKVKQETESLIKNIEQELIRRNIN